MKTLAAILLFLMLPAGGCFAIDAQYNLKKPSISLSAYSNNKLEAFISAISSKKNNHTEGYYRFVFHKTQSTFLKQYQAFSPLNTVLESGNFDCVSGTTLLAYVFQRLDIPFVIMESPAHSYILIKDKLKTYLIESTAGKNGFVSDAQEINVIEEKYRNAKFNSSFCISAGIHEISFEELLGLEYFNAGVLDYNQGKLDESVEHLEKALVLNKSEKILELYYSCLGKILETNYTEAEELSLCREKYSYYAIQQSKKANQ